MLKIYALSVDKVSGYLNDWKPKKTWNDLNFRIWL